MGGKFAILMDGGFVKKKIQQRTKSFPTVAGIEDEVKRIKRHAALEGCELLRVYFYDAVPASGVLTNPLDASRHDLSTHKYYSPNISLHQALELQPDFALRMGEASVYGWTIGSAALKSLTKTPRAPVARDLVPDIQQKGVDLRIGLDIARLALRSMVDAVVVVTGDSDLIPAFKFARREGVRIYLDHMGHGVKRELKVHADLIL
jgi:uncharacterized LabA/DUF88 family protein